MSQATLIPVAAFAVPCAMCGRYDTVRGGFHRPHFALPQPTRERQTAIEAWLVRTPASACLCLRHVGQIAPLTSSAPDWRLMNLAIAAMWFAQFGRPVSGHKAEWRAARRRPLEGRAGVKQRLARLVRRFARRARSAAS